MPDKLPALSPQPASENDAALLEKLLAVESSTLVVSDSVTTCWYRNPNGPEAAARIAILGEERDTAQSLVEAWARIVEGLKAHIVDREAMGDSASPTTYLSILRADVACVLENSKRVRASRWHDAKVAREQVDRLEAENARLREALERIEAYQPPRQIDVDPYQAIATFAKQTARAALGDGK